MAKSDIDILFENDQILLINKPSGISVTADRSGKPDVLQLLKKQLNPSEPLRLVHRLDKETSGILLIAKHKDAQSRYSRLFAKREISKLYLAIVNGPLGYTGGSIKDPIARSQRNPQAMHIHPRLGKPAHTIWKRLAGECAVIRPTDQDEGEVESGVAVLTERDALFAEWMQNHSCAAVIVRPDRYVLGVANDASELNRLVELLEGHIFG